MAGDGVSDKSAGGRWIYVGVEKMPVFSIGSCSFGLLADVRRVYVGRKIFEEVG
jgi:hypothetical protein